jgi:hypothetical protein
MKKESKTSHRSSAPVAQLNIDNLTRMLDQLSDEPERIRRPRVDEIFRAIRFELPYSVPVINATLAASLSSDAPHYYDDLTLNEMVVQLTKALFNPAQVDSIAEAVHVYYSARFRGEKEYATTIVEPVLAANPLTAFPPEVWPHFQELALTVMEKIIHEKQSRGLPGHTSQSVLELIQPFIYYRLANPELEKIKLGQPQVFKKWLTSVAHDGYEKINDAQKFRQIQNEKEEAFETLKKFITSKTYNKTTINRHLDKIRIAQNEKNKNHAKLNKRLDEFFSAQIVLAKSADELRGRFHEKLRRLFAKADTDPAVYATEDPTHNAYESAYQQIKDDLGALNKLINLVTTIEKNYSKSLMISLLGGSNVNNLHAILNDTLLGRPTKKRDPHTGAMVSARDGGYPQKTVPEIYDILISELQKFRNQVSGLFSNPLKLQIQHGIEELSAIKNTLTLTEEPEAEETAPVPAEVPADAQTEKPAETTAAAQPVEVENPAEVTPPPPAPLSTPEPDAEPENLLTPLLVEEDEAKNIFPLSPTLPPIIPPEPENKPAAEETVDEKLFKLETEHQISDTDFEPDTVYTTISTPPDDTVTDPEFQYPQEPEAAPTASTPPATSEPVVPDLDLVFDDTNEIPEIQLEPVHVQETPSNEPAGDPGLAIMSNYQLGSFTEAVHDAWKIMLVNAVNKNENAEEMDLHAITSEQEVFLYVICALVQQVAAINEESLQGEKKEILQSISTLLQAALKDPLEENNWSFFEGPRRDDVDRAIAMLKA